MIHEFTAARGPCRGGALQRGCVLPGRRHRHGHPHRPRTGEERTSAALGASLEASGQPIPPTGLAVSGAGVLVDTRPAPDNIHMLDPVTLEEVGTLDDDGRSGRHGDRQATARCGSCGSEPTRSFTSRPRHCDRRALTAARQSTRRHPPTDEAQSEEDGGDDHEAGRACRGRRSGCGTSSRRAT